MGKNSWKTWHISKILNDIKILNGSRHFLIFLNLLLFKWFEYVGRSQQLKKQRKNNDNNNY